MKLVIFTGQQQAAWSVFIKPILANNALLSHIDRPLIQFLEENTLSTAVESSVDTAQSESIYCACVDDPAELKQLAFTNIDYQWVLFYSSPETALISSLKKSSSEDASPETEKQSAQWTEQAETLLELYLNHGSNSRLYNLEKCQNSSALFLAALQEQLALTSPLIASQSELRNTSPAAHSNILTLWAAGVVRENPSLELIYEQLESAGECLITEQTIMVDQSMLIAKSATDLQQLLKNTDSKQQLETAKVQLENAISELEAQLSEWQTKNQQLDGDYQQTLEQLTLIQTALDQAEVQIQHHQLQSEQLNQELMTVKTQLREKNTQLGELSVQAQSDKQQLSEENELALLQIHQLQEELEQILVKTEQQSVEYSELTKSKEQAVEQLTTEKHQLTVQLNQLESTKTELESENELSMLQINQLQEELEQTFLNAQRFEGQLNELMNNHNIGQQQFAENKTQLEAELAKIKADNVNFINQKEQALAQVKQLEQELSKANKQAQQFKSQCDESNQKLSTVSKQAENQKAQYASQIKQVENEKAQCADQLNQVQADKQQLTEENELALLQIHQLQEELEQLFLKSEQQQNTQQSLTAEKLQLTEQLSKINDESAELIAENELSLLQINQLQEELEYYYLQYQNGTIWHPLDPAEKAQTGKSLPFHLTESLTLMSKLKSLA